MKKYISFSIIIWMFIGVSCNNNTYSKQLKAERKLIESYISRMGINVISDTPEVWGEKDFLEVPDQDDFYFHLSVAGDTNRPIALNDVVTIRYKKYSLDEYADTISLWTTLDSGSPVVFAYNYSTSDGASCTGWHVAIEQMKYYGAECRIICPSKLGFAGDNSSVTPYCYDLHVEKKPK